MGSSAHTKRLILFFSFITLSFVFFFFLNESPKGEKEPLVTEARRNPPNDVISTLEVRGKYVPPSSWTKFEGQESETEEELESAILGVDAPISADIVGGAGIDVNIVRNEIEDEEKLREKVVMEDPTWVSWQKMNQVRYLGLLTGTAFSSSFSHIHFTSTISAVCYIRLKLCVNNKLSLAPTYYAAQKFRFCDTEYARCCYSSIFQKTYSKYS